MWSTDGTVTALVRDGQTLYLGGTFRKIGPTTGGGALVDADSGAARAGFPQIAGSVRVAIADGMGGWFIGGTFEAVGGREIHNLAHVASDGSLEFWKPDPNGSVYALCLEAGRLYVGGEFTNIAGRPRKFLACFSGPRLNQLTAIEEPNAPVRSLVVSDPDLIIGGEFTSIGDSARAYLGAVSLDRGRVTRWRPNADYIVRAVAVDGRTVYVGGDFNMIGDSLRARLGAIDRFTGRVLGWNPTVWTQSYPYIAPPYVASIAVSDSAVFVAGHFAVIDGQLRGGVAAIDRAGHVIPTWDPIATDPSGLFPPYVHAIALRGHALAIAGEFSHLNGVTRPNVGAVDQFSGATTDWDPRASGPAWCVASGGQQVLIGGEFTIVGAIARYGLAAMDLVTGMATPWAPACDGLPEAMAISGGRVYVGGRFTSIGGVPRLNLASISCATANVSAEDYPITGSFLTQVRALFATNDTLYVGGTFNSIGGVPRLNAAAIDLLSGEIAPWRPDPDDFVSCITSHGRTILLGGAFGTVGGAPRMSVAAVDPGTGLPSPWQITCDGVVEALVPTDSALYLGGNFSSVDSTRRVDLAAVDPSTGALRDFNPALVDPGAVDGVRQLVLIDGTLAVAGNFGGADGADRPSFVALDAETGRLRLGSPQVDGPLFAMVPWEDGVIVGGAIVRVDREPHGGVAAIGGLAGGRVGQPPTAQLSIGVIAPNPTHAESTVDLSLSRATHVTLSLYDIAGRRAKIYLSQLLPGGTHRVVIDTASLPNGLYICRLDGDGHAVSRKVTVLR